LGCIEDAPTVLFVRGAVEVLQRKGMAVIGSPYADAFGRRTAHAVPQRCVAAGYTVISGLAAGCDTAAHRGCLDADGVTIALLAHGLDHICPPENKDLANEIVARDGALVSACLLEQAPAPAHFIARGRLQSGLSQGVIFIQSEREGGAMHRVSFAHQQRRPVGVFVPPSALRERPLYGGNRQLISTESVWPLTDLARNAE